MRHLRLIDLKNRRLMHFRFRNYFEQMRKHGNFLKIMFGYSSIKARLPPLCVSGEAAAKSACQGQCRRPGTLLEGSTPRHAVPRVIPLEFILRLEQPKAQITDQATELDDSKSKADSAEQKSLESNP